MNYYKRQQVKYKMAIGIGVAIGTIPFIPIIIGVIKEMDDWNIIALMAVLWIFIGITKLIERANRDENRKH